MEKNQFQYVYHKVGFLLFLKECIMTNFQENLKVIKINWEKKCTTSDFSDTKPTKTKEQNIYMKPTLAFPFETLTSPKNYASINLCTYKSSQVFSP